MAPVNSLSRKTIIVSSLVIVPLVAILVRDFLYHRKGWHSSDIQIETIFWVIRAVLSPLVIAYTVRWWTELNKVSRLVCMQTVGFVMYSLIHWGLSFAACKWFLQDFDPRNLNLFNTIRQESSLLNLSVYLISVFIFYAWVYFERYSQADIKSKLLEQKLEDAKDESATAATKAPEKLVSLSIKSGSKTIIISVNDVICFQANGPYVKVITNERSLLMNTPLYALENQLPGTFLRVHRSSLVNIAFIRETKSLLNGDYTLILNNGLEVRASRTYREKLRLALGKL